MFDRHARYRTPLLRRRRRATIEEHDRGMTLVEVLISTAIVTLIGGVIASAIIVVFREVSNTRGRTTVASAEQSVGLWMPADLSSADTVNTDPETTPCGAPSCDGIDLAGGSNVMQLAWSTQGSAGTTYTRVSYNFAPDSGGRFLLRRVKCTSTDESFWDCQVTVVLRDLPGPPAGEPFVPGVAYGSACSAPGSTLNCTRPSWVITVSQPLAPDATTSEQLSTNADDKNANRVVVTINGGGRTSGAGGGINQISITAGGTVRSTIDANSLQGAPSFSEIRSRCGGAITLVVDESNSIGTSITQVREGVRQFIQSLVGTPTKIQVIGFHTFSRVIGSSEWQKYWDMTKDSDVTALLASVDSIQGTWTTVPNGATNWEEALFRVFRAANGSTAPTLPGTMVFFTDGLPTFDRLVHRTSPGVLPTDPPAPGAPWPTSTGGSYSQVAFNRARYLADEFRTSVRFIGVGVGSSITTNSNWIVDPGAGYRTVWERGSYSYVRDSTTYQLRYQKRDSSSLPYYWVNYNTYIAAASNMRRDLNWTNVSQSVYLTVENPVNTSTTDGARTVLTSTPVSTVEYQANSSDAAYRAVAKTWAAGPDWEIWTGSRSSGASTEYRSTKLYNSPPYEAYDPAVTASTRNDIILARMIAGNDYGTPAVFDGTNYTNAAIADMYVLPQWSQFITAMKAVSLGQCGGTLTLQTKRNGAAVADPFRYQNSAVLSPAGTEIPVEPRVVTTNQQFTTGTFDFSIANGQYVTVEVLPQNFSELTGYTPVGWSCRSGITSLPFTTVPIPGQSTWTGIRVNVAANAAVSCTLSVQQT